MGQRGDCEERGWLSSNGIRWRTSDPRIKMPATYCWEMAAELLGRSVWQGELCEVEDYWCGDTQIIGVPMYDREIPTDELGERLRGLAELAEKVYVQVMHKEPEDGSCLMSWTRVF